MRVYNSFKEIDRDLKYLKLKKQIGAQTVKLNYAQTKESISPVAIVSSTLGSIAKKVLFLKVFNKIIGRK